MARSLLTREEPGTGSTDDPLPHQGSRSPSPCSRPNERNRAAVHVRTASARSRPCRSPRLSQCQPSDGWKTLSLYWARPGNTPKRYLVLAGATESSIHIVDLAAEKSNCMRPHIGI